MISITDLAFSSLLFIAVTNLLAHLLPALPPQSSQAMTPLVARLDRPARKSLLSSVSRSTACLGKYLAMCLTFSGLALVLLIKYLAVFKPTEVPPRPNCLRNFNPYCARFLTPLGIVKSRSSYNPFSSGSLNRSFLLELGWLAGSKSVSKGVFGNFPVLNAVIKALHLANAH